MDDVLPVIPTEIGDAPACCHHWVIQPAVGPVSEGACQKCGEVREFRNSLDYEAEWTNRRETTRSDGSRMARSLEDLDELAG
jgi:hypothetical protein